ncbi:MAG: hypothetical protein Q8L14_23830 [Myxococcales bacterium]|nr:hypothetical protein [Myxococcales bacterium]
MSFPPDFTRGSASARGTPAWPQGGGMSDVTLSLRSPPSVVNGVRSSLCDFWDTLQP